MSSQKPPGWRCWGSRFKSPFPTYNRPLRDRPANSGRRRCNGEVPDVPRPWVSATAAVDDLAAGKYGLVGGIGQHDDIWRMAHVRGPEEIVVSLAERID
jgi:hypothetical protein